MKRKFKHRKTGIIGTNDPDSDYFLHFERGDGEVTCLESISMEFIEGSKDWEEIDDLERKAGSLWDRLIDLHEEFLQKTSKEGLDKLMSDFDVECSNNDNLKQSEDIIVEEELNYNNCLAIIQGAIEKPNMYQRALALKELELLEGFAKLHLQSQDKKKKR